MEERTFETLRDLVTSVTRYLPTLLAGLLVLLLGLVAAWAVSRLLVRLLVLMRLDRVLARLRLTSALASGDARHTLFELIGDIAGAFVFIVFLDNALVIWGLTVLSDLFTRILLLIPKFIAVALIMLAGWGLANLVSRSVQRLLYREQIARAALIATLVRWAVLVTTFAAVLVELKIAVTIITGAFLIILGSLALCVVLAVGLGSKRGVELMWEDYFGRLRERNAGNGKPTAKPVADPEEK